ncbi:PEP-CTERM sorting domain-containing protein [Tunturibacter psychrotolerans]|uniref:PEP-CTERM sorting domain-containing protein n=1 Tax=Tunturiibacter psychrotolerans TaxID=3069686 RepID=A0AAU7ZPI9_9BACT
MITTKRSLQALFCLGFTLLVSISCKADIISATSSRLNVAQVGPVTNGLVNFTNWNPGGCGGVSPCIVGASIIPITLFEDVSTSSITFTYGSDFDFDYASTGPGDRLILRYLLPPQGLDLNLGITGASLYLTGPPQGIPDIGIPPSSGLSSCPSDNPNTGNYCYSFDQDLTGSSGSNFANVSLPYKTAGLDEVDIYLAVQDLNPNGGTFTITQDAVNIAPEPSSFILLGSGFVGVAGLMRRRVKHLRANNQ